MSLPHRTDGVGADRYSAAVIDLHTHSACSDGSDTPTELAANAAAAGLTAIALTDHDTTSSHEEMAAACANHGIELVAGVEVSLRDTAVTRRDADGSEHPINVHVLAYFVPVDESSAIQRALAELRTDRDTRNRALVDLLVSLGFADLTLDYLVHLAGRVDSIGRPHFARAMTELHPEIVGPASTESTSRIFSEWLGVGGRAYIPKTERTIEEFVRTGDGDGVVFSIAHPLLNYGLTNHSAIVSRGPALLSSLRDRGITGVEAYYGGTTEETRRVVAKVTRDVGMVPTGGSDYHGTYKPDVALAKGRFGDLHVQDEVLVELKAARL
jgi:3',5'-nucleoside bisphosphate phosphatase